MKLITTEHELHKPFSAPEGFELVESHILSRTSSGRWNEPTYRETHIVCLWKETSHTGENR